MSHPSVVLAFDDKMRNLKLHCAQYAQENLGSCVVNTHGLKAATVALFYRSSSFDIRDCIVVFRFRAGTVSLLWHRKRKRKNFKTNFDPSAAITHDTKSSNGDALSAMGDKNYFSLFIASP